MGRFGIRPFWGMILLSSIMFASNNQNQQLATLDNVTECIQEVSASTVNSPRKQVSFREDTEYVNLKSVVVSASSGNLFDDIQRYDSWSAASDCSTRPPTGVECCGTRSPSRNSNRCCSTNPPEGVTDRETIPTIMSLDVLESSFNSPKRLQQCAGDGDDFKKFEFPSVPIAEQLTKDEKLVVIKFLEKKSKNSLFNSYNNKNITSRRKARDRSFRDKVRNDILKSKREFQVSEKSRF